MFLGLPENKDIKMPKISWNWESKSNDVAYTRCSVSDG